MWLAGALADSVFMSCKYFSRFYAAGFCFPGFSMWAARNSPRVLYWIGPLISRWRLDIHILFIFLWLLYLLLWAYRTVAGGACTYFAASRPAVLHRDGRRIFVLSLDLWRCHGVALVVARIACPGVCAFMRELASG